MRFNNFNPIFHESFNPEGKMNKIILSLLTLSVVFFISTIITGCQFFALMTTPEKKLDNRETPLSKMAEDFFWFNFHAGNYDSIPKMKNLLTAAYLENPGNSIIAAHIAFVNLWELAERQKSKDTNNATIIYNATIAKKFFAESYMLNPTDPRIEGFLGVAQMTEGTINEDEKETVKGYFTLDHAVGDWPEFNDFTMGYMLTQLPKSNSRFPEGIEMFWDNLDVCTETSVSRTNPDYTPFMRMETTNGEKRVCWNGWIAPHNFEGFFMAFGDALVKNGQVETAVKIYNNAKLSKTYNTWKYREFLENRIANAKENVQFFNDASQTDDNKVIMFKSSFSCMGCHQQ
jgi:hypothetical protein